jgi:hypothetical protein
MHGDAAVAGLDSDEPDVVPALVDRVVEQMRMELVDAIAAGVVAGKRARTTVHPFRAAPHVSRMGMRAQRQEAA